MKTKTPLFRIDRLLFAALALLAAPQVQAQLYYQTNGTNATWTTAVWNTTGSGTFNSAWVSGTNVIFGTASGGTNRITFATTTVGDITVNDNTVITAGGSVSTKSGGSTVNVASGVTLTWTAQARSTSSGAFNWTKSGDGTWDMGASSGNGAVGSSFTLNAGTIIMSGAGALGGANALLTINGGSISVSGARTFANSSVVIGGDFGVTNTGSGTFSGGVNLGTSVRTITNDASGTTTFSGIISNSGGLTLTGAGAGTTTLSGLNTYTGKTTVSGANVFLSGSGRAGATASDLEVSSGKLDLGTGAKTNVVFTLSGGAITNGTLHATTYALQGGTVHANLSTGTATVTTGTTTLNGTLGATTVNVNSGALTLGSANRLADGAAVAVAGGTLGMGANNDTVSSFAITSGTLGGSGTLTAATYALQGGTVDAVLGAGAITVSSGTTTLGSAGRLNTASSLTVNSGQLSLSGNETVASLAGSGGTVALGANTLTAGGGNTSASFAGVLSGEGNFAKSGTGTLTMTGVNTLSGTTTVSNGRLVVDGTNASSAVTVSSGGSLGGTGEVGGLSVSGLLAPGNSVGTLSAGATTFNTGGAFELEMWDWTSTAGTGWDLLDVTGDLTLSLSGAGAFTINLVSMESSTTAGSSVNFNQTLSFTNTFVSFSGAQTGAAFAASLFAVDTSNFLNPFTGTFSITNISGGLALVYTALEIGDEFEWDAGAGNWNTSGNWTNNSVPPSTGAMIYYSGVGGLSTNDVATEINGLTFLTGAGAYTVDGDALTMGVLGVVNESTAVQTVDLDLKLGGAQIFDAASGDLVFGGTLDNDGNLLTVEGASNVTLGGTVSGSGGLTKIGSGSLTLGGNNTFSGALAVNVGTVLINGTQAATTMNIGGGTLLLGASDVLVNGATIALSTGTVNLGGFSDTITTFNQSGGVFTNGTLTATTYGLSGGTVAGTLGAGTANVTGGVTLSGAINSTLNVNSGGSVTASGTAGGAVNINTGGTFTLAAADRIGNSSAVTVDAGTLATVTFSDTVGSLLLTNSGSLTGSGTITAGTYTLNGGTVGANLGTGTATSSAGTTTLNGTLEGDLALSGGTVNLGSGDRIGNSSAVTVSSGTLGLGANNDTVGNFTITGGTLGGSGTLTASTYALQGGNVNAVLGTGAVTVSSGTTTLGSAGRLNSASTLTVDSGQVTLGGSETVASLAGSGGTVALGANTLTAGGGNASTTYSGVFTGVGSLAKTGTGSLTLGGDNGSYAGTVNLQAGAIIAANNNALGTNSVTLTNGTVAAKAGVTISNAFAIGTAAVNTTNFGATTVLAGWNMNGLSVGATNVSISTVASGASGQTMSLGAGVTNGAVANALGGAGWNFTTAAGAIANNSFVTFGLSASTTNSVLRLSTLDPFVYRASSSAPTNATLQYSLNGGSSYTDLFSTNGFARNNNSLSYNSIDVSAGGTLLQAVGTNGVVFRWVNYGATSDGGTWYVRDATGDDLVLNGQVGSIVNIAATGSGTLGISEAGTATFSGNVLNNTAATLTAASGGTATFSGAISGAGTLNKTGIGTVTLSGASANTFSGTTTVSAGTLQLNKTADTVAIAGDIEMNDGAFLLLSSSGNVADAAEITLSGGTITRGSGVSEVFGNLNIAGGSILDFGTGAVGDLQFQNYSYTGSSLVAVQNFLPGNRLQFLGTSFSAGDLADFNFGSFAFTSGLQGDYFTITAIPEPSTYLAAAGLLGLMLWPSRKRIIRDTKKILGLTLPMRARFAARLEQKMKLKA